MHHNKVNVFSNSNHQSKRFKLKLKLYDWFNENFSFLTQLLALVKQVLSGLYTMFNVIIWMINVIICKNILQIDWAHPRQCAFYLHCAAVLMRNSSCAIAYKKIISLLYEQHSWSHVNLARTWKCFYMFCAYVLSLVFSLFWQKIR